MFLMQGFARTALKMLGWRLLDLPERPLRAVLIAYPHTSNWDFPIGLLAMHALALNARWVGKDSLFRGPCGAVMRWLGGIPVNRREPTGFVADIGATLRTAPPFVLVIAPEGTRGLRPGWKSGFYRIARAAGVPLLIGLIDYRRKRIGVVASIDLTGDEESDMQRIAACYGDVVGLRPALACPIRLL